MDKIMIFLVVATCCFLIWAVIQVIGIFFPTAREARERQSVEDFIREQREELAKLLSTLPTGLVAAPAPTGPALTRAEEYRQVVRDSEQGMSEEESRDADRMASEEAQDISTERAIAETERILGLPPLEPLPLESINWSHTIPARASIPQEDASPRVLNIGGVHYAVPELAARGNLVPGQGIPGVADAESAEAFERRVINDLMLRRGRQLMVENNWTAQQAADAVTEMVRVAGIQGVEEVMAPRTAATAQLERPMSPEQRLRLAEDMMMRHAENLIRGGVPVEEAATRAADWGMQFAYSGPAPRAERRPTVREVWSD